MLKFLKKEEISNGSAGILMEATEVLNDSILQGSTDVIPC